MRVIVTRPGPQAGKWVGALRAAGHDALSLPLIEITAAPDTDAVAACWHRLSDLDALMFVSANAVEHFFACRPQHGPASNPPLRPRLWATGPGTVAALLAAGAAANQIDAPAADAGQFDSEALWSVVQAQVQPGWRVLIVRGSTANTEEPEGGSGTGRDWLTARLAEQQAAVEFVVVYGRGAPVLSANALVLVQVASADGSVWIFSSSEAVANLGAVAAGVGWSKARAIATHARIAQAAREAGFAVVLESRPGVADLLASIESLA